MTNFYNDRQKKGSGGNKHSGTTEILSKANAIGNSPFLRDGKNSASPALAGRKNTSRSNPKSVYRNTAPKRGHGTPGHVGHERDMSLATTDKCGGKIKHQNEGEPSPLAGMPLRKSGTDHPSVIMGMAKSAF